MTRLTPRCLVLPLSALAVITALHATSLRHDGAGERCGPAVAIRDPDLRRSFARFDHDQSAAARKICDAYAAAH
jgi:hypothetical protein